MHTCPEVGAVVENKGNDLTNIFRYNGMHGNI